MQVLDTWPTRRDDAEPCCSSRSPCGGPASHRSDPYEVTWRGERDLSGREGHSRPQVAQAKLLCPRPRPWSRRARRWAGVGGADCVSDLMNRGRLTVSLSIWLVDTLSDDSGHQRAHPQCPAALLSHTQRSSSVSAASTSAARAAMASSMVKPSASVIRSAAVATLAVPTSAHPPA